MTTTLPAGLDLAADGGGLRWPRGRRRRLGLALQGGGAHGAFTWGVLDALLESDEIELVAASGASAGALNAVVMAQGLMSAGPDGARRALAAFWQAVARALPVEPVEVSADGAQVQMAAWFRTMLWWSRQLRDSGLRPDGDDLLSTILSDQVDFGGLQRHPPLRLFIAATQARSARLRVFREHEISLDAVLASACLPQWRRSVWIDDEPYWDGAFSANPPLLPLLRDGGVRDLLLVLLLPTQRHLVLGSAREVESRLLELGFITPFLAELRTLLAQPAHRWWLPWRGNTRWHCIDASVVLGAMPTETRLAPGARFLGLLQDLGRARGREWLQLNAGQVGRRATADLGRLVA